MSEKQEPSIETLKAEVRALRKRVEEFETLEAEYKNANKQLAEKEAFNFALFQFNPIFTVVVDSEGRVIKSNKAKISSGDRLPKIGDVMYKDYASRHRIDMYKNLMDCIRSGKTGSFPELEYGTKILSITISPFPRGAIITSRDITTQKIAERDRLKLIDKLQQALAELETLRGLLPICACCKKIRDDHGYWNHIESYLRKHTLADFTHTLCPDCVKQFYPDLWKKMEITKEAEIKGQ
jgi:hypothetical protein